MGSMVLMVLIDARALRREGIVDVEKELGLLLSEGRLEVEMDVLGVRRWSDSSVRVGGGSDPQDIVGDRDATDRAWMVGLVGSSLGVGSSDLESERSVSWTNILLTSRPVGVVSPLPVPCLVGVVFRFSF